VKSNYAFIDSQNLHKGIQESGWKLDFIKFRNYLKTKYNISKAYLFIGYIETNNNLYKQLQSWNYCLIFKPVLKIRKNGKVEYKGNVDAEMVLHTIINMNHYNKAVIVSGDGDFHCLVEYLDKKSKLEKILTPNNRYSSFIREYSKYIMPLETIKNKLELKIQK
jgi:uncharacterized LabA/DUF88 family protein